MTAEDEIDRLFALPLDEFTSTRNALAKQLKKDGDADAAAEVAALAKPSVPVWAINQLARRQKANVKKLLEAAAKLREAQEQALAGGDPAALREAQAAEREAVRDLTRRAATILADAGRPASRAALERTRSTLSAAALSEPGRTALEAGRLTGELEVTGFDALAGIEPKPSRAPRHDELAERRQKKAERERARRRLEKNLQRLEDRAREAEEKADRAEEAAEAAREVAEERRRAADAASSELALFDSRPA